MIRVHLFGSVELRSESGGEIRSVLAQPKRTALLAYLAATTPGNTRRGTLLALFWPDLDEAHARNALSKSIHHLRQSLGTDVIVSRGNEELGLSMDHVWCDVAAFESALDRDLEAALDLYARGPLMDGFVLAELPGLEHWLDGRRAQLQRQAREAAGTLLERVIDSGDSVKAVEIGRRVVALFPHDETLLRQLLTMLDLSGDRAGAVRAYQDFASRLERDLELEPSPETDALARAIRARAVVADQGESANAPGGGSPPGEPELALPRRVIESDVEASPATSGPRRGSHRLLLALLGLLLLGAAGVVTARIRGSSDRGANIDPDLVAVLPFRVSGAEPSLGYLREGMLDLLGARLAGEAIPRAVDPRTVINAWRRVAGSDESDLPATQSLALARGLGAGRVVLGEVVSLPGRLALSASLHDVLSGKVDRPITVEGPPDSLLSLVDRLAAGLLTLQAGEGKRLGALMTASLPALRLYLEGQSAYRRGHPDTAKLRFARAVEIDSMFATAGLWWWRSRLRSGGPERLDLIELLWRHRERLGDRDRAFYDAAAGPNWPGFYSAYDRVRAHQDLVERYPDDPDFWFFWALVLPNAGAVLGIPDTIALRRAADGFGRVLALDSTYLDALETLGHMAFQLGDTASGRRYSEQYLARAPTGAEAEIVRCRLDAGTRGLAALPALVARLDSLGAPVAFFCLFSLHGMRTASTVRDSVANHLGRRFLADPGIPGLDGLLLASALYQVASDRGRPAEAVRYLTAARAAGMGDTLRYLAARISEPLYWYGDGDAAERAATAAAELLANQSAEQLASLSPTDRVPVVDALWALGQWRLAQGDTASAQPIIRQLRELGGETLTNDEAVLLLAAEALQAWYAVQANGFDADARIARLDSLVGSVVKRPPFDSQVELILAALYEARGDYKDALRVLGAFRISAWGHASTVWRERGRIALLAGDTAGALSAWQRYLAMRADPEPELIPEVDRIRAEVTRLMRNARN